MFYPQEMAEIEIIVPAKDLLSVTKILGDKGIFNQIDVNYLGNEKVNPQSSQWQEKNSAYSALERRLQSILNSLGIHDVNPKDHNFGQLVDLDETQKAVDEIDLAVKGSVEQIAFETKEIERFRNLIQQVTPLSDIELDFSQLHETKYITSILGMMPPENIDRLKTSLSRIPYVFYTLSNKHKKAIVWLASSQSNTDILNRAARSAYLDPISLPSDQKGTPAEIIASLNHSISDAENKITLLKANLVKVRAEKEEEILSLLWKIRCSRMMTSSILHYGHLKYTYIIVGWIFTSKLALIKEKIKDISKEALIDAHPTERKKDSLDVPTALVNPRLIRPFQMLVTTYSEPKYNELDPTPLVALLFPILFGAMFGDVGHGLILALLGILITSKKVKAFKGLLSLGPIIIACGAIAMVFGFLYGSLFGYEDIIPALWLRPGLNIMTILIVTLACGVVVLSVGFLLNIYNTFKVKDWSAFFFSHNGVAGLIFYWSLLGFGATFLLPNFPISKIYFLITTILSGTGVAFAEIFIHLLEGHRPLIEGSLGFYFVQVFFELFETLISYFSNSISFVRVGAFAVAHGYLCGVFFMIGQMVDPSKGIGYWLIFLIGLVFIVGFEGLIVGIQSMRLTYYEIFGKFFVGGGKRFEPLTLHPVEND